MEAGSPSWIVYNGKPKNRWCGGIPIYGNLHLIKLIILAILQQCYVERLVWTWKIIPDSGNTMANHPQLSRIKGTSEINHPVSKTTTVSLRMAKVVLWVPHYRSDWLVISGFQHWKCFQDARGDIHYICSGFPLSILGLFFLGNNQPHLPGNFGVTNGDRRNVSHIFSLRAWSALRTSWTSSKWTRSPWTWPRSRWPTTAIA